MPSLKRDARPVRAARAMHILMPMQLSVDDIDLASLADVLRRSLGRHLVASYLRGKTLMRDAVEAHLHCSEMEAEELVETLELQGYVRFPHFADDTHPRTRRARIRRAAPLSPDRRAAGRAATCSKRMARARERGPKSATTVISTARAAGRDVTMRWILGRRSEARCGARTRTRARTRSVANGTSCRSGRTPARTSTITRAS